MSLKDQIKQQIRTDITSGTLALGTKLSENSLAKKLSVSRTPVREALQALKNDGLVTVEPQRGTFVFTLSATELDQICAFRTILEKGALNTIDLSQAAPVIETILMTAEIALEQGDLETCHRLDTDFHSALIDHCDNAYLQEAYRSISDRVTALRQLLPMTENRLRNGLDGHHRIVQALSDGDVAEAKSCLESHIVRVAMLQKQAGND
jgi:DNA-binding GntR family transcriptional regulator